MKKRETQRFKRLIGELERGNLLSESDMRYVEQAIHPNGVEKAVERLDEFRRIQYWAKIKEEAETSPIKTQRTTKTKGTKA